MPLTASWFLCNAGKAIQREPPSGIPDGRFFFTLFIS
jgi:hypothetical protein